MAFKRSFKKRKFAKKRVFKRRSFAPKKKAIRKLVRREITRAAEVKTVQYLDLTTNLASSPNAAAPIDNIFQLGPDGVNIAINQGTAQAQRVGNRIQTKSLMFKGTVTTLPWEAATNPNPRPIMLKMVIFYDRNDDHAKPNPFAGGAAGPFQGGGGSNNFQNDLVDMWLPFNNDRYRIFTTRTWKLGYAAYDGAATTTSGQFNAQQFANNDYKLSVNFSLNLTKYYPKVVKFNDNNAIPTTRALFCMFYWALADGQQAGNGWAMANVAYQQSYQYTDI